MGFSLIMEAVGADIIGSAAADFIGTTLAVDAGTAAIATAAGVDATAGGLLASGVVDSSISGFGSGVTGDASLTSGNLAGTGGTSTVATDAASMAGSGASGTAAADAAMTGGTSLSGVSAGSGATSLVDPATVAANNTSAGAGTGGGMSATDVAKLASSVSNVFGMTPQSGVSPSTADPFAPYRSSAADNLNKLMANPALAMSSPGYQMQLSQGLEATNRAAAAGGQLASGGELAAANSLGQNTFSSYYNTMLGNLMQMSGASQNPASGTAAASSAANVNSLINQRNISNMAAGAGGLAKIYNSGVFGQAGNAISDGYNYLFGG